MLSDVESAAGASIAAGRLASSLIDSGAKITQVVGRKGKGAYPWETKTLTAKDYEGKLARFIKGRYSRVLARQIVVGALNIRLNRMLCELHPDIINIHNMHSNIARWDLSLVETCSRYAPVVWTLHDMWSFTGRCAYSYDCRKFLKGCDASCPTPTEYPALSPELISGAWKKRQRIFAQYKKLTAVSPSRWLAREAETGLWQGHRVEIIPNGLPLNIYCPLDKKMARRKLGISPDGLVVLVVAGILDERRKGGSTLVQALEGIEHLPITLITMGSGNILISTAGIESHSLGFIENEQKKVLAYNAADFLVHPAPVDNLPNVIMESIACGTPCVGFNVGGIPDMVRPGLTGWLCQDESPGALKQAIDDAIYDINLGVDLRRTCRSVAQDEYDVHIQANHYLQLFHSLC